jgi:MFS family permease
MDPSQFPDGGTKAWLTVVGSFCCLFVSFGWINSIGVFQQYYQTHQLSNFSASTIAWIPGLEVFILMLMGAFVGKIYDNFGPRILLAVGLCLHTFGLMMTSISTKYYQFILAQGICSPIGIACVFYPAISTTASWFFKKRALALGIVTAGSSLGGVIFPIALPLLINEVGFAWALRIIAFIILLLLIVANLTMTSRVPPHPHPLVLKSFVVPFAEAPFLLFAIGSFFVFLTIFVPMDYLNLQGEQSGMPVSLSNYLLPVLNAVSIIGRVLPAFLADRWGKFNVCIIMAMFTALMVLVLWVPVTASLEAGHVSVNALFAVAALYGLGSGTYVALLTAIIAQLTKDMRTMGTRIGAHYVVISFATLISNPIAGAILDSQNGSYVGLACFTGASQIVGVAFICWSRISFGGASLKKVL